MKYAIDCQNNSGKYNKEDFHDSGNRGGTLWGMCWGDMLGVDGAERSTWNGFLEDCESASIEATVGLGPLSSQRELERDWGRELPA